MVSFLGRFFHVSALEYFFPRQTLFKRCKIIYPNRALNFIPQLNMAFKLRLARHGAKKRPFYWIMAADARAPRETGKEKLGTYNPFLNKDDPLRLQLKEERIRYWLSCGAQPTDRVRVFLEKAAILAPRPPKTPVKKSEAQSTQ